MNDIKQRRQKSASRYNTYATRSLLPSRAPRVVANPVKLRVTPLSTLTVQELLSLQLRFLEHRRGQAYSESKSPSHTLHIIRLISDSDSHRKRIRYIRLHYRLSSNSRLERSVERWDRLGQDLQRYGPQLQHKSLHRLSSTKLPSNLHLCE